MILQHCNWRTVEEWKDMNVPLSTPSNQASKMFDASITQLYHFYNDPTVGGFRSSVTAMLEADPHFVMGQALLLGIRVMGGESPRCDPEFKAAIDKMMKEAAEQTHLAPSERKHAAAVKLMSDGCLKDACDVWEDILLDHPTDPLALRMAWVGYIYTGDSRQLRDCVARILPHWKTTTPLYGFLLGMHAFGLEETNMFDRAEKLATKALEINPHDAWSVHAMSHVYEMTGQQDKGIAFLDSTVKDWDSCDMLACHNWWHKALHFIEKGNYEEAMQIFETQVEPRCIKSKDLFNISDCAALLFRLEMEGVKVDKAKWQSVMKVSENRLDEHMSTFNDLHLFMTCLGSDDAKATEHFMDSLEQFVSDTSGSTRDIQSNIGVPLCQAMAAYKEGDFALATELVYPLRYQIFTVGGSNAQRDIFNLFLISSAMKSSKKEHHRLARVLLAERKALKDNSPATDRLTASVMALHGN